MLVVEGLVLVLQVAWESICLIYGLNALSKCRGSSAL